MLGSIARLGLKAQLSTLVAVLMLFGVALGLQGLWGMRNSEAALQRVNTDRVQPLAQLKGISDAYAVKIVDASHKARSGALTMAQAGDEVREARGTISDQWKAYTATELTEEEARLVATTEAMLAKVDGTVDALAEILERGDREALARFTAESMYPAIDPLTGKLGQLIDLQLAVANEEYGRATASYDATRNTMAGLLVVSLLAGGVMAWWIISRIVKALGTDPTTATGIATRIAKGDLTFALEVPKGAEGSLLGALKEMKDNLLNNRLDFQGQLDAIGATQAVIEFTPEGTVLRANDNFLKATGHELEEVQGKHHRQFVPVEDHDSAEYLGFWSALARGEAQAGVFRRKRKDGRDMYLQATYTPIRDLEGKVFKVVKYAADVTVARQEAQMNAAFKGTLETIGSNVMVADNDGRIIFINQAVRDLMSDAQADFRKDLPNFEASRLVGQSMDVFHRNASHQKNLLGRLTGRHDMQFVLGGRTMKLAAYPMKDEQGRRLGSVVEWFDRTQEIATEKELAHVIGAVVEGDLSSRIRLDNKRGFFETLSRGINDLVDNVGAVVSEVQHLVQAANSGDLTRRVQTEGKAGLLVKIGTGINELTENMAGIVAQVKAAAEEVSRGADEISQGNTNLSQRTEEQASSLEETASSMEQMTSTVRQNADNAGQANQLAVAARDQAEKGGAVVARAVTAMTEINVASKRIADIIGVIDEIAFQTNLLALNAAVEAARAGEQGRGFAVVASEVRNLAGRSATAAKEIKGLIQDSVRKVDEGSELVTQSGATLEQIVGAVKKVTDIVAEIAAASHEQSSGIEQVNKAVMQLDELTQQNAALVEQASAASQAMAEQARGLAQTMSRYEVGGTGHGAAAGAGNAMRRAGSRSARAA